MPCALQQPAHEVVLHTQAPPTHARPGPQAAWVPQRQLAAGQLSVVLAGHATHAEPLVPQVAVLLARHSPVSSQQPLGHVAALQRGTHWPASQLPVPQLKQVVPEAPQV